MKPEAFVKAPEAGCTATHVAGCTPGEPASFSVKVGLDATCTQSRCELEIGVRSGRRPRLDFEDRLGNQSGRPPRTYIDPHLYRPVHR